ncbi:hypothetical protein DY000_02003008 [Brassica cretica]|uniref:Uncharacterized protein n=1 Tax=Brassica cretica TaxID=69181 RepID=A0ABQ7CJQ0_BRACR|nr:hypothetical protein DY000_02003008 [Brassica cretica]
MKLQQPRFIPPLPSPSIDFSSTIHHHQSVDLLHDRRLRLSLVCVFTLTDQEHGSMDMRTDQECGSRDNCNTDLVINASEDVIVS